MAVHTQLAQTASRHPVILAVGVAGVMQVVFPGAISRIIPSKLRSALLDIFPSESPLLTFPTQLRPVGLAFVDLAPKWKPSMWGTMGYWPGFLRLKSSQTEHTNTVEVGVGSENAHDHMQEKVGGAVDDIGGVALGGDNGGDNGGAEGQGDHQQHGEHQHDDHHHQDDHQHHDNHQHHEHSG